MSKFRRYSGDTIELDYKSCEPKIRQLLRDILESWGFKEE